MATTTIRVDLGTHARLRSLSQRTGRQMSDVVRDATDALELVRFARTVSAELDAMRADPARWDSYVAKAEELPLGDGIA